MVKRNERMNDLYQALPRETQKMVDLTVARMVAAKKNNGRIVVVTGSGPNLHEGVTTLIAELINKSIIDGVTTSSAVIAHEMAGVLDKVKRVDGKKLGFSTDLLPKGDIFEVSLMKTSMLKELEQEMVIDTKLIEKTLALDGKVIIKAAGNMAYPMGLWAEKLAKELLFISRSKGISFEAAAGAGADPRTMLGAAFNRKIPCLVTVPQLVGGGMVGIAVADSISIAERTSKIAEMLASADIIIESAVALTQEIHDGPFETYTGHGIWSEWEGYSVYRLKEKTLVRIDLDPNLKKAWDLDKESSKVQHAIDDGAPKTKLFDIPFRMEMSGFARLENSIPIVADIGIVWPIIAERVAKELGISLDFLSYPQQTPEGQKMREWIVDEISLIDKAKIHQRL